MTTTTPFPTREHLTALSMVGRVVTDGVQVGVVRMVDGPDWVVATNGDSSEARFVPVPAVQWTAPGPVAQVRWHGTDYLAAVPMADLKRGVTMFKAYGLH